MCYSLTPFQQRATAETLGALARAGKPENVSGRRSEGLVCHDEGEQNNDPGNKCEVLSA